MDVLAQTGDAARVSIQLYLFDSQAAYSFLWGTGVFEAGISAPSDSRLGNPGEEGTYFNDLAPDIPTVSGDYVDWGAYDDSNNFLRVTSYPYVSDELSGLVLKTIDSSGSLRFLEPFEQDLWLVTIASCFIWVVTAIILGAIQDDRCTSWDLNTPQPTLCQSLILAVPIPP